jgi:hypothetical protein
MDTWHTARNLIEKYPEKAALIRWQLQRPRDPDEYQPAVGPTPYVQEESALLGSVHRLTQEYRMITKTLKEEWVKVDGVGDVKIPDMPDINKPQWLNENYPGWNPESVYIKTSRKRLCVVRAICPSIAPNDLLENGLCEIQIGRLPFFWWAPDRAGGEISCPMDSIKDSQENINYWMSLMTYKLQVDGGGGSQLADPSKFATRGVYDDYVQNRNDPTKIFEVKPGALDSGHGPTESTTKGQFPSEAITLVQMIFSVFLPHISKVTPSTRGIKESSGTSGKLYEAMREQSELGSFTTHYSLRLYWAEIYDAYFMLATELYSNNGVERTFSFNKGRESITLNKRVQLEDGSEGIENDVSRLKSIRHKVIISETQQSPTQKIASIKMLGELAKELGQSSPLISKYLANKICALTPSMDQEDRESIKVLGTVDIELQIQEAKTKMSGLKLQEAQAAKQLEVLMNPPPPKPPETRPPSESISFKDLPPEGQVQLAAKAGIQIGPQAAPQPVQPSMPQHQPMPAQHAPVPMPPPQPQPQPQPQSQPAQPQQAAAPADNIPNAPSGQEVG